MISRWEATGNLMPGLSSSKRSLIAVGVLLSIVVGPMARPVTARALLDEETRPAAPAGATRVLSPTDAGTPHEAGHDSEGTSVLNNGAPDSSLFAVESSSATDGFASSGQGSGGGAIAGRVSYRGDGEPGTTLDEAGVDSAIVALYSGRCGVPLASPLKTVSTSARGDYRFEDLDPGDYCVSLDEGSLRSPMINVSAGNLVHVREVQGGIHAGHDFHLAPSSVQNRVVVSLAGCGDTGWLDRQAANHGAVISRHSHKGCLFVVEAPPAQAAGLLSSLRERGDVRFAELDVRVRGELTPNDPDFSDPNVTYAPQQIDAERAWDYTTGDPSVVVAVVDSGVDFSHEEFRGSLLPGYDYVNDDDDPADDHGHGTHVAGIIGAGINNSVGMAGIAASCRLLPMKVLNASNVGYSSNVALAIMDAVDQGARVVNLSLSTGGDTTWLHEAVRYAADHGVLIVAAAGNHGSDEPRFPASYPDPNVLSVGATMRSGQRWPLSGYGPNVEVMAPGDSVHSTHWRDGAQNAYVSMTGTSMAAPHAAAAAALLLSLDPTLSPARVMEYLARTASRMPGEGTGSFAYDDLTGYGLINVGAAVQALLDDLDPSDAAIGGSVWWDRDGDGQRDLEEPGIAGVDLLLSGDAMSSVVTGSSGTCTFSALPRGTYTVTLPAHEFDPGGALEGWQRWPQGSTSDGVRADTEPVDHEFIVTLEPSQTVDGLHFGFEPLPDCQISLALNGPEPARPGDAVSFSLSITNTGHFPIDFLPLRDEYGSKYLGYVGSDPPADDTVDDGRVDWEDLTTSFGEDLAPGASFTVVVTFTARSDTSQLPGSTVTSAANVHDAHAGVWVSGTLWAAPVPSTSDLRAVRIERPNQVTVTNLRAEAVPEGIALGWKTVAEQGMVGFHVLRRSAGDVFKQVNAQLIHESADDAGGHRDYEFLDETVLRGTTYEYLLEVTASDGQVATYAWSPLTSLWWVSLPLLVR